MGRWGPSRAFRGDCRGVKWTLQAYLFLLILLGSVVVAAGSIPTDASPSEFTDFQREQTAQDLLSTTAGTGTLEDAALYWDASGKQWVGASGGPDSDAYTTLRTHQSHPLWPAVHTAAEQHQLAYNVVVRYQVDTDGDGEADATRSETVVQQGPPGHDAVSATESVILTDDDVPARASTSDDGDDCTLGEMGDGDDSGSGGCRSNAFFAPDAAPDSPRYNVVQFEVTLWSV